MITVRQITKRRDFKKFVKLPDRLYKDNKNYVPPFEQDELDLTNPKKNACFEESEAAYFLAEKDGKVVGRIAGIISHAYNLKNNAKRARFSRFECIEDKEVADKLLEACENWAREKGMDKVVGPLGYSDLEREGLLIEGFEELSTFEEQYSYDRSDGIRKNSFCADACKDAQCSVCHCRCNNAHRSRVCWRGCREYSVAPDSGCRLRYRSGTTRNNLYR